MMGSPEETGCGTLGHEGETGIHRAGASCLGVQTSCKHKNLEVLLDMTQGVFKGVTAHVVWGMD